MILVSQPEVEENFLVCDCRLGGDQILIFGRQSWLQHLLTSDLWFAVGTSSVAPSLFPQIYVIMAENKEFLLPFMLFCPTNKAPHT